jgi:hypothetical protein
MSLNNFMKIVVGAVVLAVCYGVMILAGSRTKLKDEQRQLRVFQPFVRAQQWHEEWECCVNVAATLLHFPLGIAQYADISLGAGVNSLYMHACAKQLFPLIH